MKRTDVRELIMEETKRMCRTRSIEYIQVKEICERCEISRPTFYSYFHDKYDIISQIYQKTMTDVFEDADDDDPWEILVGRMLENVQKDKEFYMSAIRYLGQNSMVIMMLYHIYTGYVMIATERTGREPDRDLLFQIRFNSYGSTGSMLDWIGTGMHEDPYELAVRVLSCMPEDMKSIFY